MRKKKLSADEQRVLKEMTNDFLLCLHWEYQDSKADPAGHRVMRDGVSASFAGPPPTPEDMQAATHAAKMELARRARRAKRGQRG